MKRNRLWPAFVCSLGLLALFWVGAAALLRFGGKPPAQDAARAQERTRALEELRALDRERLETFAWADKEAGSVRIPIGLAMRLTAARLAGKTPHPAPSPASPTPAP